MPRPTGVEAHRVDTKAMNLFDDSTARNLESSIETMTPAHDNHTGGSVVVDAPELAQPSSAEPLASAPDSRENDVRRNDVRENDPRENDSRPLEALQSDT